MANSKFLQFFWNKHTFPVWLDLQVLIGSTGAVTSFVGPGIKANGVTRGGVGAYQIHLADNYRDLLCFNYSFIASDAGIGSAVADGSFVTGTTYTITTYGTTTTWGDVPAGVTPALGVPFIASGAGGAGDGFAKAVGPNAVSNIQVVSKVTLQPSLAYQGSYILIQCFGPTDGSTTTPIPTDPTALSYMNLSFLLNNSSLE